MLIAIEIVHQAAGEEDRIKAKNWRKEEYRQQGLAASDHQTSDRDERDHWPGELANVLGRNLELFLEGPVVLLEKLELGVSCATENVADGQRVDVLAGQDDDARHA